MNTKQTWSLLSLGILAAACATAGKPDARDGGDADTAAKSTEEPNAFPGEPSAPKADLDEDAPAPSAPSEFEGDSAPTAAVPRPAPATRAPSASGSGARGRAEASTNADRSASSSAPAKKSSRPFEPAPERPGLGTAWGETVASRVSNAPFERASRNPFSLTTIRYNDRTGIEAMLRSGGDEPVALTAFRTDNAATVGGGMLTVRLVDANGAPLPTYAGGGRMLAQGEVGQRYMIELTNQSANRYEAVVTVDGLDVIDGRAGSLDKRGYLLAPYATVEIDGFRQNMDEVAAFRFGSVRGSYAAQKGNDRNVGVIGVAFFAERGADPWSERELRRRESADPFPGRFATPPVVR